MDMAQNILIVWVKGLRRTVVSNVWVGEHPSVQIGDLQLDLEILVRCEVIPRCWVGQDSGDHVGRGRDVTHCYLDLARECKLAWERSYGFRCMNRSLFATRWSTFCPHRR